MSSGEADENEYEVESIVEARVERSRGKLWKYCVKWKGYPHEDNTWEPMESFDNSEELLAQFWQRADTNGRDPHNLSLFKVGEEFFPTGPPRRIGEPKASVSQDNVIVVSSQTPSPMPESSKSKSKASDKRKHSDSASRDMGQPPIKRLRGRVSDPGVSTRTPLRRRKSAGTAVSASRPPATYVRRPRRRARVSPSVPPSAASDNEIMEDYGIDAATLRRTADNVSRTVVEATPELVPSDVPETPDPAPVQMPETPVKAHPVRPKARRTPDEDDVTPTETVVHNSPLFGDEDDGSSPSAQSDSAEMNTPIPAPKLTPLPAHRARVTKPLVRRVEDVNYAGLEGAISVKARLMGRSIAAPHSKAPPSTAEKGASGGPSSVRASGSKPGPGRSSKGLQKKSTSSLLTFEKGALKTVKGKYRPESTLASEATETIQDSLQTDITTLESPANNGPIPLLPIHDTVELPSVPQQPPTGKELLELAGFEAGEAEALPDFEDDALEQGKSAQVTPLLNKSLALAKDKLFPTSITTASISNVYSALKRSTNTIFGPLALGLENSANSGDTGAAPLESLPTSRFILTLDSSASVPVLFSDVSSPSADSPSLHSIIGNPSKGPPGKFYNNQYALALLDTLRTGGPCARVGAAPGATPAEKSHLERFIARLDAGELFVAMAGVQLLAFCSSHNALIGQRLNISPSLQGSPGTVLVSSVTIDNYSAYADAAVNADTVRW